MHRQLISAGRWDKPYHSPKRAIPDPSEDPEGRRGGWHRPHWQHRGVLVDISPASMQRSAPQKGEMQLQSACEEGVMTQWEAKWDDGEREQGRGYGCGLGMR